MGSQNAIATEAYESIKTNADFVEGQAATTTLVWIKHSFICLVLK